MRTHQQEANVNESSTTGRDIQRLILVPALITLAVTAARLAGELAHGPRRFFNPEAGGSGAIVGIVWLAPLFGIYFALKLAAQGQGPKSFLRAIGFSLLGVALVYAFGFLGSLLHMQQNFRARLVYVWTVVAVSALVTLPGWKALFRTLVAYAYAARVPVAVVMFLAFWRDWGTHYDAVPPDLPEGLGLMGKYFWLGFFPQLTFWVGLTVLAGMVLGSITAGIVHLARRHRQPNKS